MKVMWLGVEDVSRLLPVEWTSWPLTLFLHFSGHFPDEPRLGVFTAAKDDGSGGDNWSYKSCNSPVKLATTDQHPTLYRPDALPVAQPTVSKHWRVYITFHGLADPKLTWGLQLYLWSLTAPGYLGGGLPCLSSAIPCQSACRSH